MFSDEILEMILSREEVRRIPCAYKSDLIHVIEEVLEREEKEKDNAVYKQLF